MEDAALHAEVETRLRKVVAAEADELNRQIDMFFGVGEKLGYRSRSGDRILDFGCGLGDTVALLLERNADAFGVDVMELWGSDHSSYWRQSKIPDSRVIERLRKVDTDPYHIPFEDNSFDFCISSQVFEHVFDYREVFSELARVLKPGALSLHLFPGPWSPLEAHINVPVIPLCRYRWWLSLWAWGGRRSERQENMPWREVVEVNASIMQNTNYPLRRVLREAARSCGLQIDFAEEAYIRCSRSRPNTIMNASASRGLGWAVSPLLQMLSQRMMVIWKTA
jgi:SAM-dependent methyltransferase